VGTSEQPAVDVVDSTWLAAAPSVVGPVLAEPANWSRWWPGLEFRVHQQRGEVGVQWSIDSVVDVEPALAGSAEVWLEAACGGTVAHFFLRLDTTSGRPAPRTVVRHVTDRYRRLTKQAFWALGDSLDPGRLTRLTSVPAPPKR
jgi:hypothetical protein